MWKEEGTYASEPIFVANPQGKEEDDGVVLSALLHEHEPNSATLLILDAKDLGEMARVCFETKGTFTSTMSQSPLSWQISQMETLGGW